MLDVLRKHASSWLIKVILGAIIVSFIFFFGYSSYRKGTRGSRVGNAKGAVASVNGLSISDAEYEFFLDRGLERMRASFEGKEMPPFLRTMAESQTLQMLVAREVTLQLADQLGITIPDDMLADIIRKSQTGPDGEFDPIAYTHRFLPYFQNRYGMDYELLVRHDLMIGTVEKIFDQVDAAPPLFAGAAPQTTWTFEAVTIDPNALVASKAVASEEEATAIADRLVAAPNDWAKILKPLKVEPKKVGPIGVAERKGLFEGQGLLEDYLKAFGLTPQKSVIDRPIQRAGKLYVVRLLSSATKEATPSFQGEFYREWMSKLLAQAKVQNYLKQQQP